MVLKLEQLQIWLAMSARYVMHLANVLSLVRFFKTMCVCFNPWKVLGFFFYIFLLCFAHFIRSFNQYVTCLFQMLQFCVFTYTFLSPLWFRTMSFNFVKLPAIFSFIQKGFMSPINVLFIWQCVSCLCAGVFLADPVFCSSGIDTSFSLIHYVL